MAQTNTKNDTQETNSKIIHKKSKNHTQEIQKSYTRNKFKNHTQEILSQSLLLMIYYLYR
jgi:hypothetical protein